MALKSIFILSANDLAYSSITGQYIDIVDDNWLKYNKIFWVYSTSYLVKLIFEDNFFFKIW